MQQIERTRMLSEDLRKLVEASIADCDWSSDDESIVKVTEETVVIETGKDRTKLHILKSAIRSVDVHAADTIENSEK